MKSQAFDRFSGYCAIIAGVCVLVYSIAFVLLKNPLLYSMAQLLGGLLTLAALTAIYRQVKENEPSFALLALELGLVGALGSALHAGYDLANALNPPDASLAGLANLPSQIDPRGLLTFGFAGMALFIFSPLMEQSDRFPKMLGTLGYVLAALLVLTFLARLIILDAGSPLVLIPAALTGFFANPLFYIWLGIALMK